MNMKRLTEFQTSEFEEAVETLQDYLYSVKNASWSTLYGFENTDKDVIDSKVSIINSIHHSNTDLVRAAKDALFIKVIANENTGSLQRALCADRRIAEAIAEDTGLRVRIYNCKMLDTEKYL